jgi:hypothetical protein
VSPYDVSASFRLLLISSVSITNDEPQRVKDAATNASIDNTLIRIICIWSNLFSDYVGFYRFFIAQKEKDSNLRGVMLTKRITVFFFKCMSWEGIESRVLLRGFFV